MTKQELFANHYQDVYFFLLKKTNDPNVAQDVLQTTFLKGLDNYNSLKDKSKIKSWLFQISRNEMVNYYKEEAHYNSSIEEERRKTEDYGEKDLRSSERFCCFDKFLNELPLIYKRPMVLVYKEGQKQTDAARTLGLKLTTVKARIRRAKQILVTKFNECCRYKIDNDGKLVGEQDCARCNTVL